MNGQREQIVSFLQKILLGNGRISSVDFDGEYLEISTKDGKTVRLTIPEKDRKVICCGTAEEKERLRTRFLEWFAAIPHSEVEELIKRLESYENAKKRLILRTLNYDARKEDLKSVPHIRIGDIALALYIVVSHKGSDYYTAKVSREVLERWDVEEDTVMEEALKNTASLYPPRLYTVEEMIAGMGKSPESGGIIMQEEAEEILKNVNNYILTNELEINGAIAAFYPGVAEHIAEIFEDDFYLAFTSCHEAQIHKAGEFDVTIIEECLRRVNRECNQEMDILTDRVYLYSREKQCFMVRENGAFQKTGKGIRS